MQKKFRRSKFGSAAVSQPLLERASVSSAAGNRDRAVARTGNPYQGQSCSARARAIAGHTHRWNQVTERLLKLALAGTAAVVGEGSRRGLSQLVKAAMTSRSGTRETSTRDCGAAFGDERLQWTRPVASATAEALVR